MYPWKDSLARWADSTGLHVDALGLVTILGAEEVDQRVGRLVPSRYVEYLPLLGAYVIASNKFTEKKTGFAIYNLSSGMQTTELAGWFLRWLKAQDFHQVRSTVTWKVGKRPRRNMQFWVGLLLVGIPLNGVLIALTILCDDWWGFVNAISMTLSVVVRSVLVRQMRTGIDKAISMAKIRVDQEYAKAQIKYAEKLEKYQNDLSAEETKRGTAKPSLEIHQEPKPPQNPFDNAKMIVIMDDSKAVTVWAPNYLIGPVLAKTPPIPRPRLYFSFQCLGWAVFTLHIISLGMAALPTQIYTAALLIIATILTYFKFGCDDYRLGAKGKKAVERGTENKEQLPLCWVSSTLGAHCSEYPKAYADWRSIEAADPTLTDGILKAEQRTVNEEQTWDIPSGTVTPMSGKDGRLENDLEAGVVKASEAGVTRSERRQDLYAWLELTPDEFQMLKQWYLIPENEEWIDELNAKRREHDKRLRGIKSQRV